MKQYIGIVKDHSVSMNRVKDAALNDYNAVIQSLKSNSIKHGIDTIVSVVDCAVRDSSPTRYYGCTDNKFSVINSSIAAVKTLKTYELSGRSTPLFDAVNMLIDQFKHVPDYNGDDVSFLIMVVTDGDDNDSKVVTGSQLAAIINKLESTDKWTVSFRVPTDYREALICLGIKPHNILGFDAADSVEFEKSTVQTSSAIDSFYQGRTVGVRSTSSFFASTENLTTQEVRNELSNISKKVKVIKVTKADEDKQIRDFIEEKLDSYVLGTVYYQLTKKEKIQPQKKFILWDKEAGQYYTGVEARKMLGLVSNGEIRVNPADMPRFEIFVQSTSVNRKLKSGTKVVVYKG